MIITSLNLNRVMGWVMPALHSLLGAIKELAYSQPRGTRATESGILLGTQVQEMGFGSHIEKYGLMMQGLYSFGLSNFNNLLLRCGSPNIHIKFQSILLVKVKRK